MSMHEEEDDISFLNPERLKKTKEKPESGEIPCKMDPPEDCETCRG